MEREVEGGIGMRSTCKPMDVSFQCMTKFTTNKKKKKEKKKKVTSSVYKMNCLSVSTSILSYVIQNIVDVTQLITLTSEMKR